MGDDPWVMHLVVRKDVPLGPGRATALAGGAGVRCADELGASAAAVLDGLPVLP